MERLRQKLNKTDCIEQIASFYGYANVRHFYEQAKAGKVLGLYYEPGYGIQWHEVCFVDGNYIIRGPVPDNPQRYILPIGTMYVDHEVCSGVVSGRIYQGKVIQREHYHAEVELTSHPGCSGVVVWIHPLPKIDNGV